MNTSERHDTMRSLNWPQQSHGESQQNFVALQENIKANAVALALPLQQEQPHSAERLYSRDPPSQKRDSTESYPASSGEREVNPIRYYQSIGNVTTMQEDPLYETSYRHLHEISHEKKD